MVRINHLKAEELSATIVDSYDFIILAKVQANENTATTRNTGESWFYLHVRILSWASLIDRDLYQTTKHPDIW